MKRNTAIALFALSSLGAAARVLAQTRAVQAAVPFEFTVGGRLLPADTYTLTSSSPGIVMIESADKHISVTTTASHGNQQSPGGSRLVFAKYGDKYFLRQVLCPAATAMNVDIPKSKLEKNIQRQEATLGQLPEPVLLAAR